MSPLRVADHEVWQKMRRPFSFAWALAMASGFLLCGAMKAQEAQVPRSGDSCGRSEPADRRSRFLREEG